MKKMLTLLLSVFLLVGLVSCDALGGDEGTEVEGDNTYTYQVQWDAQLTDSDYAASASVVDANGAVAMTIGGAMQLGQVTSTIVTDSYFGEGNALNYVHDGVDSWGGVFFNGVAADNDLSAVTEFKIAIKGDIPSELTCWGYKVQGGSETEKEVNLMLYEVENGDADWRLFVIPATDFSAVVELDAFSGIGIWNPKQGTDLLFEGGYVGCDVIIDIAIK